MQIRKEIWGAGLAAIIGIAAVAGLFTYGRGLWVPIYYDWAGRRTVADVVAAYGPDAEARLGPHFRRAGVSFPPGKVALLAMKAERRLELWAGDDAAGLRFIRAYDILAASGGPGPKLREGDRQVPEGLYRISALRPNSAYHLSLMLDYPNAFDRGHARAEGRTRPGSNIFIHGKALSIGCLAMGDRAIEDLFILTARVGAARVSVAIAPYDPRGRPLDGSAADLPRWTPDLYAALNDAFEGVRNGGKASE